MAEFKPQIETYICNNCKTPFPRMKKVCSKGRLPKGVRRKGSVTCCRRCSRLWSRHSTRIRNNRKKSNKKRK